MRVICIVGATALLAGCLTSNVTETHFFHPGPARDPAPVGGPGMNVQAEILRVTDGTELGSVHVIDPAADVEVLYFGGDMFRIDDFGGELARIVTPMQANFFMVDYRGYGRSGGTPTVEALKSDALSAFDHLRERTGTRPIVVHGFSLGSFMAAHVAANRPVAGLVLESSAPDVEQWAKAQIPLLAKPAVRLNIAPALRRENNVRTLETVRQPVLLMTGSLDSITPARFSSAMFQSAVSVDKRVFIVPGARHGNVMAFPTAQAEYAAFLDRVRRAHR